VTIDLRPVHDADLPAILALNNAAHPAVPVTDESELAELVSLCSSATVADSNGRVVAFLLAVDPGSDYASENYAFFSSRAEKAGNTFLYIDRIVVADSSRGTGIGRRLYEAAFVQASRDGRDEVTCEVNIDPPNPESLAFHERMGFSRVGDQVTKGGAVVVALMAAPVTR